MIPYTPIPVLFSIGGIKIYSYGVMLALAFLTSLLIAKRRAKGEFIQKHLDNIILLGVLGGIFGARIGFVILNTKQFVNPLDAFRIWDGGLTSYGGIFGALCFIFTYIKIKRLHFLDVMDFLSPYVALGFAIGRIGCLLNWDNYGKPTTVAWAFVVDKVPRHPTQIYLSFSLLILFGLLYILYEKTHKNLKPSQPQLGFLYKRGFVFLLFMLLYSSINFMIDFVRYYPPEQYFFGLALTQWITMLIFFIAGISLASRR